MTIKPNGSNKILLLGANGQLGHAFLDALNIPPVFIETKPLTTYNSRLDTVPESAAAYKTDAEAEVKANYPPNTQLFALNGPSSGGLDLTDLTKLQEVLLHYQPDLVINAAAYTAVDQAEVEKEKAYCINAQVPELIAQTIQRWHGKLIHFSTDYVFNPEMPAHSAMDSCIDKGFVERLPACAEDDRAQPINYYGLSKLAGENAIIASGVEALIVRTSWLYSALGKNFVRTMMSLMQEREQIKVVADQWGVPTSVDFVVLYTLALWQEGARSLFHIVPMGRCSWFEFAQAIADELRQASRQLKLKDLVAQTYQQYYQHLQEQICAQGQSFMQGPSFAHGQASDWQHAQLQNDKLMDRGRGVAQRPQAAILSNQRLQDFIKQTDVALAPLPTWQEELRRTLQAILSASNT